MIQQAWKPNKTIKWKEFMTTGADDMFINTKNPLKKVGFVLSPLWFLLSLTLIFATFALV